MQTWKEGELPGVVNVLRDRAEIGEFFIQPGIRRRQGFD